MRAARWARHHYLAALGYPACAAILAGAIGSHNWLVILPAVSSAGLITICQVKDKVIRLQSDTIERYLQTVQLLRSDLERDRQRKKAWLS